MTRTARWCVPLLLILTAGPSAPAGPGGGAAPPPSMGDWRYYAADAGSTKYSPLAQIDGSNVGKLEVAWRWTSIDYELARAHGPLRTTNMFETTPIAIDGVLYVGTGMGAAAAIDGTTGKTKWVWNPFERTAEDRRGSMGFSINRGLGSWRGPSGEDRLFLVSHGNLVSLDAASGKPDVAFGNAGSIDLCSLGEGREPYDTYFWTSPPLLCGDVVVVGNSTTDPYNYKTSPPGTIRGYDVRSGKMLWLFDIIPRPGQFGHDTWLEGSADYTGHGNVWTWMSCDPELGYVYAPTSTPTDDWYGGHRPGDGLFGESLVALDARTGERVWHFQAVHHGLWDYDFPAAPILVDVTVDGKPVKAVAQVSKQAFTYVFDRVTGKPVWPIEERPVPQSDVPGERSSPTQPFPTKPPAFDLQGLTPADLIDLTPELHAEALAILEKQSYGPIFLPPRLFEGNATARSARCRCRVRSAAPTGTAPRSTPRPGSSTCRRSRLPWSRRSARRPRAATCATWSAAAASSTGPAARRKPVAPRTIRCRSPVRRGVGSPPSISTAARSCGSPPTATVHATILLSPGSTYRRSVSAVAPRRCSPRRSSSCPKDRRT